MTYTHEQREQRPRVIHTAPFPVVAQVPGADYFRMMEKYLSVRHLSYPEAAYNGWYPSTQAGDTVPRIVIPATSEHIGHNYWQARSMNPDNEDTQRYQSPEASRLDAVIVCHPTKPIDEIVLVEGPMCALAAAELGRTGIALMGNTPSTDVLFHVSHLCASSRVLFLADSDATQEAAVVVGQLASLGVVVKLRLTRGDKDLAASSRRLRFQLVTWED